MATTAWKGTLTRKSSSTCEFFGRRSRECVPGFANTDGSCKRRATLSLAHARDQILNQRRLETYLATTVEPQFDLSSKLNGSSAPRSRAGSRYRSPGPGASGANTPRDLNTRVKILELYTLHVLLRNNEWDYAREFISESPVLDEERREAFLQALQSLQEEQREQERLEEQERFRQQDELRRQNEEARRRIADDEARERKRLDAEGARQDDDHGADGRYTRSIRSQHVPSKPSISSRQHNSKAATAPATFTGRATVIMGRLQSAIEEVARSLNNNPALLTRFLVFLIGFLVMMGHRGLRQRLQRILGAGWAKVMATAGMGTKVSYI